MAVPEKIKELVAKSGNNFHSKVARWFANQDWDITVSPYYLDQMQGKAREIDLIVEKYLEMHVQGKYLGYLVVRLFVECKFVNQDAVFWFAKQDKHSTQKLIHSSIGADPDTNLKPSYHHYFKNNRKVAKLFASNAERFTENEIFYRALNQTLNSMTSMRNRPTSIRELEDFPEHVKAIVNFPVIVCNSFERVFAVDFFSDSEPNPVEENFLFEVRYAYIDEQNQHKNEYFLLDFVDFSQLDKFVDLVDLDAKGLSSFLKNSELSQALRGTR